MWPRLRFWRQFRLKTLLLGMFVAAVACGAYRLGYKAGNSERLTRKGADFDTLIDLITSTIAPTTWEDAGGAGSIDGFEPNCWVGLRDTSVAPNDPLKPIPKPRSVADEQDRVFTFPAVPISAHPDDPFR